MALPAMISRSVISSTSRSGRTQPALRTSMSCSAPPWTGSSRVRALTLRNRARPGCRRQGASAMAIRRHSQFRSRMRPIRWASAKRSSTLSPGGHVVRTRQRLVADDGAVGETADRLVHHAEVVLGEGAVDAGRPRRAVSEAGGKIDLAAGDAVAAPLARRGGVRESGDRPGVGPGFADRPSHADVGLTGGDRDGVDGGAQPLRRNGGLCGAHLHHQRGELVAAEHRPRHPSLGGWRSSSGRRRGAARRRPRGRIRR